MLAHSNTVDTHTHIHMRAPPSSLFLCSLLAAGLKGLHLYTLNMEEACFSILESLDLKLPLPTAAEGE